MASDVPEGRQLNPLRNIPVLEDEFIILRPVESSDAEDMFEYGSDPEVVRFLPWGPYRSLDEVRRGIDNFFFMRPESGLPAAYAVVWKENRKMIGTCDFHSVDAGGNSGGIGFVLNRRYWGKGIMTRAAAMVVEMGRTHLGYTKVTLAHVPENLAAARVAEKLGFLETGRNEHRFMAGQDSRMMVHYELVFD